MARALQIPKSELAFGRRAAVPIQMSLFTCNADLEDEEWEWRIALAQAKARAEATPSPEAIASRPACAPVAPHNLARPRLRRGPHILRRQDDDTVIRKPNPEMLEALRAGVFDDVHDTPTRPNLSIVAIAAAAGLESATEPDDLHDSWHRHDTQVE